MVTLSSRAATLTNLARRRHQVVEQSTGRYFRNSARHAATTDENVRITIVTVIGRAPQDLSGEQPNVLEWQSAIQPIAAEPSTCRVLRVHAFLGVNNREQNLQSMDVESRSTRAHGFQLRRAGPSHRVRQVPKILRAIRAPATPLIACDPYFSVWSPATRLTDADTTHWTGKPHRLTSLVSIDGKVYRLIGREPSNLPPLEQTATSIRPTQTGYRFSGGGVEITLTFTTPALPDDIDILSRPITYLTYTVQSSDGKPHDVRLYFEASAELDSQHSRSSGHRRSRTTWHARCHENGFAGSTHPRAQGRRPADRLGLPLPGRTGRSSGGLCACRAVIRCATPLSPEKANAGRASPSAACRPTLRRTDVRSASRQSRAGRSLVSRRLRRFVLDRVHAPTAATLLASQRTRRRRAARRSRTRLRDAGRALHQIRRGADQRPRAGRRQRVRRARRRWPIASALPPASSSPTPTASRSSSAKRIIPTAASGRPTCSTRCRRNSCCSGRPWRSRSSCRS